MSQGGVRSQMDSIRFVSEGGGDLKVEVKPSALRIEWSAMKISLCAGRKHASSRVRVGRVGLKGGTRVNQQDLELLGWWNSH